MSEGWASQEPHTTGAFDLTRNKIWIFPWVIRDQRTALSVPLKFMFTLLLSSVFQNWQPSISRLFHYLWSPKAFPLRSEGFSSVFSHGSLVLKISSQRLPPRWLTHTSSPISTPTPTPTCPIALAFVHSIPNTYFIFQFLKSCYFLIGSHFLGHDDFEVVVSGIKLHRAGVTGMLHHTMLKLSILKFSVFKSWCSGIFV